MSDNISKSIASSFAKRMRKRTASARSGRFDLRLADYEILNDHEARILVSYQKGLGVPKRASLMEWVGSSFRGAATLVLESPRFHKDMGCVVAIVRRNEVRRPLKHVASMLPVGPRYMDSDSVIWEVAQNDAGERYLIRASKDDMEAILSARQSEERTASLHHRPRLRDIRDAGVTELEVGDHVAYIGKGGILQRGQIAHLSEDSAQIKTGASVEPVPTANIVEVTEKSPAAKRQHDKFLEDFFSRAYGPDFPVKKFVYLK